MLTESKRQELKLELLQMMWNQLRAPGGSIGFENVDFYAPKSPDEAVVVATAQQILDRWPGVFKVVNWKSGFALVWAKDVSALEDPIRKANEDAGFIIDGEQSLDLRSLREEVAAANLADNMKATEAAPSATVETPAITDEGGDA